MKVHTTAWGDDATAPPPPPAPPPPDLPAFVVEPMPAKPREQLGFLDEAKLATVLLHTKASWGTGWVIAVQGGQRIVVTNHHVIAPALGKRGLDGRIRGFFLTSIGDPVGAPAKVLAEDKARDIAILKIPFADRRVKALRLGAPAAETAPKRERVVVIGFPFGNLSVGGENTSPSLNLGDTDGEVKQRFGNTYMKVVAGIHPGNSGGPVLAATGEVVGVATLQEYSQASVANGARFNYAVPVADIVALAKRKKIDLRSDVVIGGGVPPDEFEAEPPHLRRSLAVIDAASQRLTCALVAVSPGAGAWLMCDALADDVADVKGAVVFPAEGREAHPATLVSNRGGFSLFTTSHAPALPPATIVASSTLRELGVVKRVRAANMTSFGVADVRVSSVRKDRTNSAAMHVLVDSGVDDESPVGGVYMTNTGLLVGVEAVAGGGTNLRGVVPADTAWPSIDEASAPRVPERGHVVVDDATGMKAVFPRLAARIEARYDGHDADAGVAYRSMGAGSLCTVEAWREPPEPTQALLGRALEDATTIRAARDGASVIRIDDVDGGEVRRIFDGAAFVRVDARGVTDPTRCGARLSRTPAPAEVGALDAWSTALAAHADRAAKTSTATAAKAKRGSENTDDGGAVCGVWSWPKVRSPDGTFALAMPCAPTKKQTLSGRVVVTTLVARPSKRHDFEVATWLNPASTQGTDDEESATSSYDDVIDSYLQVNVLEEAFTRLGARTEENRVTEVRALEGDEERATMNAMLQTGTAPDGRSVLALAALDRGTVVYLLVAVVPPADEARAERFLTSFHLIAETDQGPAVKLDLPVGKQMRSYHEAEARRKERERLRRQERWR